MLIEAWRQQFGSTCPNNIPLGSILPVPVLLTSGGIIVRSERELGSDAVARLSAGALASTLDGVLCMCGVCRAHQIAALCLVLKDFKLCGTMWLRSFAFDPCRVFLCCSAFSATCLRLFLAVCCCFLLFAAVCLLEFCGVA